MGSIVKMKLKKKTKQLDGCFIIMHHGLLSSTSSSSLLEEGIVISSSFNICPQFGLRRINFVAWRWMDGWMVGGRGSLPWNLSPKQIVACGACVSLVSQKSILCTKLFTEFKTTNLPLNSQIHVIKSGMKAEGLSQEEAVQKSVLPSHLKLRSSIVLKGIFIISSFTEIPIIWGIYCVFSVSNIKE